MGDDRAALPVYDRMGDLIGRKGLFLDARVIFIVGSPIGGFADNMAWLIIGRAVQGIGGGGLMILSDTIFADVVPARKRGRYMADHQGCVCAFLARRTACRRLAHRRTRLALGPVDEHPAQYPGHCLCGHLHATAEDRGQQAANELGWHRAACHRLNLFCARDDVGRHELRLGPHQRRL